MNISPVYHGAPAPGREATEDAVYALLQELHIPFDRVDTDAAFTMADCEAISRALGVDICKNLVLTPHNKSAYYLFAMPADKPFVTKEFSREIGSSRLSFASEEDMAQLLGVKPGSASVLALMNDTEGRVKLVMDRQVYEAEYFGCHPCRNTSSLRIKMRDLLDIFLPHVRHDVLVIH